MNLGGDMLVAFNTHDEKYLEFLRKTFGTGSLPLFGVMISIVSFVFVLLIIMVNMQNVRKINVNAASENEKKPLNPIRRRVMR